MLTPGGQPIIQIYLIGIYVVISMRVWGGVNAFTLHGAVCKGGVNAFTLFVAQFAHAWLGSGVYLLTPMMISFPSVRLKSPDCLAGECSVDLCVSRCAAVGLNASRLFRLYPCLSRHSSFCRLSGPCPYRLFLRHRLFQHR